MNVASLVENRKNPKIPAIAPGDTVKVSARIVEGGKERIQVFQGVVIQVKKGGAGASFTVRHVAFGIGVERTFPFASPLVEKVEIVRHGKVRRAKLYYLRGLSSRQVRRKIKRVEKRTDEIGAELLAPEPEEVLEPTEVLGEEGEMVAVEAEPEAAGAPAEEPVAEAGAEEPKAEAVAEPVAEEASEPVAEAGAEEPKAEETAEEPVAEVAAEEPKAEGTAEEPAAEAAEPVAEAEAEAPKAEAAAEEPVAEAAAEEPVAEETAEEPKPEEEKS